MDNVCWGGPTNSNINLSTGWSGVLKMINCNNIFTNYKNVGILN